MTGERPLVAPRNAPAEARFWSRVARLSSEECWLWLGYKHHGYGHYTTSMSTTQLAHRIAYELVHGPIPDGLLLDHLCRNPECVNPDHLEPVTAQENSRRSPLVLKDSCAEGHEYTDGSYYMDRGSRACKQCKRDQVRAYTARVGRTTATYECEFCGETRNKTGKSRHLKKSHPEHYTPRQVSEGLTPERKARRLEQQRIRRRAKAADAGGWTRGTPMSNSTARKRQTEREATS